jgi:hypothetical protein
MRKFIGVDVEFKELSDLCDKLEATSKRGERIVKISYNGI